MSILSNRNREIKQILQNTRDLMEHFNIQEKTLAEHTRQIDDHAWQINGHENRIHAIEQALIEHGVLKSGQMVVPAAEAVKIAAFEDMTVRELYQMLTDRGIIQPAEDRTSTVMRINGACVRVVRIGRKI